MATAVRVRERVHEDSVKWIYSRPVTFEEFLEMLKSRDIDAIFCARGGYGSGQLIPDIDPDLIRSNPKIVCGSSDITMSAPELSAATQARASVVFRAMASITSASVSRTPSNPRFRRASPRSAPRAPDECSSRTSMSWGRAEL